MAWVTIALSREEVGEVGEQRQALRDYSWQSLSSPSPTPTITSLLKYSLNTDFEMPLQSSFYATLYGTTITVQNQKQNSTNLMVPHCFTKMSTDLLPWQ